MPDTSSLQRQLYGLAWPAFAENVLQTALGVVSLVLVGRLGTEAVAAVGLANQIYFLTVTLLMGWSVGTTALVARQTGAGQSASAAALAQQSMLVAGAVGTAMAVLAFPFARLALVLAGATPEVADVGEPFLRWLAFSIPGVALMLVGGGALRGAGDTRWTLLGGLIGTCGLRALVAYGLGVVAGVGYPAIWLAWLSDWLMRSALFVWRFRSGRWARARV